MTTEHTQVQESGETRDHAVTGQVAAFAGRPARLECWFWIILAGICLVGLVARAFILAEFVSKNPFAEAPRVDAKVYWALAETIADGRLIQDTPFFSAPLYPYLLGLLRALGGSFITVYVVQLLIDIVTAGLLAYFARNRFSPGVGLLSAALFLFMLEPASFFLRVLTCTLQLLLLTFTWGQLVGMQTHPTPRRRVVLGVALGLLCLSYAPATILALAVGPWLFWQSARRWPDALRALIPVGIAILFIVPSALHNRYVSGDWFLIQSVTSVNLRQGNQPGSSGVYTRIPNTTVDREGLFEDVQKQYALANGQRGSWGDIQRYYLKLVLDFWREDPGRTAKLVLRKMYWFLTGRNYEDIYNPVLEMRSGFADRLRWTPVKTAWLMGPALVGLVVMLRRPVRHLPELLMFAIPFGLVAVFWYSPRYRLPALPIIVVSASWALVRAAHWRRDLLWLQATGLALGLALLLGPSNRTAGFDRIETCIPWYECSIGVTLENRGEVAGAREHYQRALQVDPTSVNALSHLGKLAFLAERYDEAMDCFQRVVMLDPGDARWHDNLGKILLVAGKEDQAVRCFERALQLNPLLVSAHMGLARYYLSRGMREEASAQFKAVVEKDPASAEARAARMVLGQSGSPSEMAESLRQALASAPQDAGVRVQLFEAMIRLDRPAEAVTVMEEGLKLAPTDLSLSSTLAWFYATCPRPEFRNGAEAVSRAEFVCRQTSAPDPRYLDILAAAYAEAGRFGEAIATLQQAIGMVERNGPAEVLPELQKRLALYQSGESFHWQDRAPGQGPGGS
ncbi:MAG: tetratricopeptide repeat protein [Planctomycetota bacterium]